MNFSGIMLPTLIQSSNQGGSNVLSIPSMHCKFLLENHDRHIWDSHIEKRLS